MPGMVHLVVLLIVLGWAVANDSSEAGSPIVQTPTGTWLGQDGRDFVGTTSKPGGNGVQDVHIALAGLPPDRIIVSAVIKGRGGDEWQVNGSDVVRRTE